jgi:hypothetical protein
MKIPLAVLESRHAYKHTDRAIQYSWALITDANASKKDLTSHIVSVTVFTPATLHTDYFMHCKRLLSDKTAVHMDTDRFVH